MSRPPKECQELTVSPAWPCHPVDTPPTPVPVPATALLVALGVALLARRLK